MTDLAYASEQDNSANNLSNMTIDSELKIDLGTVIASIIALVGSVFTGSVLAQRYRKRNLYNDPFTQWCVGAYGTIHEFKELCDKIPEEYHPKTSILFRKTPDAGYTNPTFIISHLWEMHREAEKGYKWLGQIDKQDKCASLAFNTLFDEVDSLWHYLEEEHKELLAPQTTSDNFRKILNKLHGSSTETIAEKIINRIHDENFAKIDIEKINDLKCDMKTSDVFKVVMNFLYSKIPKPWYVPNTPRE